MNQHIQNSNKWMDSNLNDAEMLDQSKVIVPIKSFEVDGKSLQLYVEAQNKKY